MTAANAMILVGDLEPARAAARYGYAVAFVAMAVIAVIGAVVVTWLVRRPDPELEAEPAPENVG